MKSTSKSLSWLGPIAAVALALTACGSAARPSETPIPADGGGSMTAPTQEPATQPATSGELAGTSWTLTQIDSTAVDASIGATLTFDADGKVNGKGGCNSFGGTYTVEGSTVTFSDIVSTLMACDEARMAVETSYLGALQGAGSFTLAADTLTITTASGVKLTFAAS